MIQKTTGSLLRKVFSNKQIPYLTLLNRQYVFQTKVDKQNKDGLQPYQKLFFSSPISQINIKMSIQSDQIRPKVAFIVITRNALNAKQINNSTQNIVQCLYSTHHSRFFYKGCPYLGDHLANLMKHKVDLQACGIFKSGVLKKMVRVLEKADSVFGQNFVELNCSFIIHALQQSIKIKQQIITQQTIYNQQKQSLQNQIQKFINENNEQQASRVRQQLMKLQEEKKQADKKQKLYFRQEQMLSGLHYVLSKGYFSKTIVNQLIVKQIVNKDKYYPSEQRINQQQELFYQKQTNFSSHNKKGIVKARLFNNFGYRIKILNQLKKIKQQTGVSLYEVHQSFDQLSIQNTANNLEENQENQQSQQNQKPQLDSNRQEMKTQTKNRQNLSQLDIQNKIISTQLYANLVSGYLNCLKDEDSLLYILKQKTTSQFVTILVTKFFKSLSIYEQFTGKNKIDLKHIKATYIKTFQNIFDIEQNGDVYAKTQSNQGVFQIILKMFDYNDRQEVFKLIKLFQQYHLSNDFSIMGSLAPFVVCNKYSYKSNFLAQMFIQKYYHFNRKQKEEVSLKQQLISLCINECKQLNIYYGLLEQPIEPILRKRSEEQQDFDEQYELTDIIQDGQQSENTIKEQVQSPQFNKMSQKSQLKVRKTVEKYLNNYNKLISLLYFQGQKNMIIGNSLEVYYQLLKKKRFGNKNDQSTLANNSLQARSLILNHKSVFKQFRQRIKFVYGPFIKKRYSKNQPHQTSISNEPVWLLEQQNLSVLEQVNTLLSFVQTAIKLQSAKNIDYFDDVFILFKSIFQNKAVTKIILANQNYPQLMKRMINICELFRSSNENEPNKIYKKIFDSTQFDLQKFIHDSRVYISKTFSYCDTLPHLEQKYQPFMNCIQYNTSYQKNSKVWKQAVYPKSDVNVLTNIRSDIIPLAIDNNLKFQKVFRNQLAKQKSLKYKQKVSTKFQINYFEYPYVADLAIRKGKQITIILVRENQIMQANSHNNCIKQYFNQCEQYFKKKGNRVVIVRNQFEIRQNLSFLMN